MEQYSYLNSSPKSQMNRISKCCIMIFVCLFFFGTFSAYSQQTKPKIAIIYLHNNMAGRSQQESQAKITELI